MIPVHLATVQSILQRLYVAPTFVKDPLGSDRLFVLVFELVRTLRKLRRVVGAPHLRIKGVVVILHARGAALAVAAARPVDAAAAAGPVDGTWPTTGFTPRLVPRPAVGVRGGGLGVGVRAPLRPHSVHVCCLEWLVSLIKASLAVVPHCPVSCIVGTLGAGRPGGAPSLFVWVLREVVGVEVGVVVCCMGCDGCGGGGGLLDAEVLRVPLLA